MSKRWIFGMLLLGGCLAQPALAEQVAQAPPSAPTAPAAAHAVQPVDVAIVVSGQTLDNEIPPLMVDGRVLIPLRKVFTALGATVKYENKVIDAVRGKETVQLSPGDNNAKINGKDVVLDVPPMLVGTVTYVPLRFVAQALGNAVLYDSAVKTITVGPAVASSAPGGNAATVPADRLDVLKRSLKRLAVGHQGAILKVWNVDSTEVAYYRGLDDRDTAPYDAEDQQSVLSNLGYTSTIPGTTQEIMDGFMQLPRREAVAYLGLVHSIPNTSPLDPPDEIDVAIEQFLINVLKTDKDVLVRRQACLALALSDTLDQDIINAILDFYAGSENLWETFPVQQFFQYQAAKIRVLPTFSQVRERVAAVNSLYTPASLRYLDGQDN